ncbi:MAG TPA: M48 family metallopeptidase [Thermoanaerobaculia bacterium]|nr:M48 family metallopeptidase [Thermoanaerobaculia bacterium]
MRRLFIFVLFSIAALANAQTNLQPGFNLFTPDEDVQIGQQSAISVEQQLPLLNDTQIDAYVDRIGQRLAAKAGGYPYHYYFKVVNASDINAFALPGGYVYVVRGTIENVHNEGELAGVMAHEIAHVALRHGTHQISKTFIADAGLTILTGITLRAGGLLPAVIVDRVGGLGLNATFLKYSREAESDADVRGSQILAAAGYSPEDMINFFRMLDKADPGKRTSFLDDHPAPADRIARIQKEAALLHVTNTATENVAQLEAIQEKVNTYGPARSMKQIQEAVESASKSKNAQQGVEPASVTIEAPSTELKTYTSRTGAYRVSYPANWQVHESATTGVIIAPPGGLRGEDLMYGAVIDHYAPINHSAADTTLRSATDDLVETIVASCRYLQLVGRSGPAQVAGAPSLTVVLRGTNPKTGFDERVTVVTRELSDTNLGFLVFVTPEKDADTYANVLRTMTGSVQINPDRQRAAAGN